MCAGFVASKALFENATCIIAPLQKRRPLPRESLKARTVPSRLARKYLILLRIFKKSPLERWVAPDWSGIQGVSLARKKAYPAPDQQPRPEQLPSEGYRLWRRASGSPGLCGLPVQRPPARRVFPRSPRQVEGAPDLRPPPPNSRK